MTTIKTPDNVGMTVASAPGTGPITLGSAITDANLGDYFTFGEAGLVAGDTVSYRAPDGNNVEIGWGVYNGTTLTRNVISSKIGGTKGTSLVTLTSAAKVFLVPTASQGMSLVNGRVVLDSTGDISLQNTLTPYTGFVATNACYNDSFNTGLRSFQGRSRHIMRENLSTFKVIYGCANGTGETAPGASWTLKVGLEYPKGATPIAINFSPAGGSSTTGTTGTATSGGMLTSDAINVTMREGDEFFLRPLINCSAGVPYSIGVDTANGEGFEASATLNAQTDKTISGTITTGGTTLKPWGIIGTATKETVIMFGDSRTAAEVDITYLGQAPDIGIVARSIGQFYAYSNMAVGGETTAQFIAGHTNRLTLAQYATKVYFGHGIADFIGGVTLASTILANLATMAGYTNISGKPITSCTLEPITTDSTNLWNTFTNQVVYSFEAQRVVFNNNIRGVGFTQPTWMTNGFVELADAAENKRDGGLWNILGGLDRNKAYTADGVHSSAFGIRNGRQRDTVNMSLFGQAISVGRGTVPAIALSAGAQEFGSLDGEIALSQAPGLQAAGNYARLDVGNFFNFANFYQRYYNPLSPLNTKEWQFNIDNTTGAWIFSTLPDDESSVAQAFQLTRSGSIPTGIIVGFNSISAPHTGQVTADAVIRQNATYTLTSQTAAQKLFNAVANGTITLPVGAYQFECEFALASMSTTSSSFGFAFAGNATRTEFWTAEAVKAVFATATAPTRSWNTAANTAIAAASTAANGHARIRGTVHITVAGTLIPQVSLGTAAAAVVQIGSWFRIAPLSATAALTSAGGPWS